MNLHHLKVGRRNLRKKIPLVELDRCEIELVTDKNYTKYVTTVGNHNHKLPRPCLHSNLNLMIPSQPNH